MRERGEYTCPKRDRHSIKPNKLPIFQNYQHQPCLFSVLKAEMRNSNEKNTQK